MINCRRPSNRSSRLTLPRGPSNSYAFSTAIHGIRRRSAASASRARISAFSFTSICWRAASQSCGDTTGGVLIPRSPLCCGVVIVLLSFVGCREAMRAGGRCHAKYGARRETLGVTSVAGLPIASGNTGGADLPRPGRTIMEPTRHGADISHGMANIEPGVTLHYVTAGAGGRTAVLLHGFPQTWREWRHVIPRLVAAGYRVVAPDYRGAGHSSRPHGGYDKRTMATDIHRLLRDALNIAGPVVLIGHDIGLMVAYAYAQAFRDEASHLVVMDAP